MGGWLAEWQAVWLGGWWAGWLPGSLARWIPGWLAGRPASQAKAKPRPSQGNEKCQSQGQARAKPRPSQGHEKCQHEQKMSRVLTVDGSEKNTESKRNAQHRTCSGLASSPRTPQPQCCMLTAWLVDVSFHVCFHHSDTWTLPNIEMRGARGSTPNSIPNSG